MDSDILILIFCISIICYFLKYIKKIECYEDPIIYKLHQALIPLDPRVKDIKIMASNASFTENKKVIYLCIKDKNGKYYDENTLKMVLIHEITHVLTNVVIETKDGHNSPEFISKFQELLEKAAKLGIYNPNIKIQNNYCGYGN